MRHQPTRRAALAVLVGFALIAAPAGALAVRPSRTPACTVSTGVTISSVKVKGTTFTTITGTAGNDTIDCRASTARNGVTIHSGGGSDDIFGTPAADSIWDDSTTAGTYVRIESGAGDDTVHAGWGTAAAFTRAVVEAGDGDDWVVAGGGSVVFAGGLGADELNAQSAFAAQLDGGAGDDRVYGPTGPTEAGSYNTLIGDDGNDFIAGGDGRDELVGGAGADQMYAGAGDDSITDYGSGEEVFDCGPGTDLANDYDGNGVGTDGSLGYLNEPEDDFHITCETVRTAASAP